jgi:hypothetical protein
MLQRDKESQTQDSPRVRQNLHRQIKRQRTIRISSGRGESRMTRVRKIMKRDQKRPRTLSNESQDPEHAVKFACPYRKHNPIKYGVSKWRSCALTPLETVARVKYGVDFYYATEFANNIKGSLVSTPPYIPMP